MKRIIALFTIAAAVVLAQSPNLTFSAGGAPVSQKPCVDAVSVGSIYTTVTNPSITYVCQQTGSTSLGQGAYGWVSSFVASVSNGTLVIASNKTATINNSITLAGTDSTTMTFPTTSATIARTDSAQTFTGVQTFSSAPVVATITNTGTVTLPTNTGGVPVAYFCGATSGTTTCANTSGGATARVIGGIATLASNTAVISAISPAFTSTSTFTCTANDITTRANPVQVVNTSSSSVTITNTTGASDVISWLCVGY